MPEGHLFMNMDYRIISFERIKKLYRDFLCTRRDEKIKGNSNEFEPSAYDLDEIQEKIGFPIASVVIVFLPYLTMEKMESYRDSNLSMHALSMDYHWISSNLLSRFCKEELGIEDMEKVYIQCDTGYFNERFFAIQTGLCMHGLNGLAIHEEYGSYGFLGLIVTAEPLAEKLSPKKTCRKCNLCIKHCPTGAIGEDGVHINRCLSYLTQKKNLTPEEEKLLARSAKIYGCDICQMICPENNHIKYTEIADFQTDLLYNIELEELNALSNKMFKKEYGNRNFSWRGKSILIRNLELKKNEQDD